MSARNRTRRQNKRPPPIPPEVEALLGTFREARQRFTPWATYRVEGPGGVTVAMTGADMIQQSDCLLAMVKAYQDGDRPAGAHALARFCRGGESLSVSVLMSGPHPPIPRLEQERVEAELTPLIGAPCVLCGQPGYFVVANILDIEESTRLGRQDGAHAVVGCALCESCRERPDYEKHVGTAVRASLNLT
jgi:hypothetical protein